MKPTTKVLLVAGMLVSAIAFAAKLPTLLHGLTPMPPSQPASAPEARLWQSGPRTVRFGTNIYRDASCRPLDKSVVLEWRYSTPTMQTGSQSNVLDQNAEVYLTRYWPTFVVSTDSYHLCVAGKGTGGDAILEAWTFATQSSGGIPAPSVGPFSDSSGTHYGWTLPPRVQAEVVLRSSNTGRGLVRGVVSSLYSTKIVFVYYDGSSELCLVNLETHAQTVVASPNGAGSSLAVTALANPYSEFWAADYVGRGYCYMFTADDDATSAIDSLVLIDSDRDGDLDTFSVVSAAAWAADGWGDAGNILPHN